MDLNKEDYIQILNYYNVSPKNNNYSYVKKLAENIIAKKLCSCIKKVPNANNPESRAIGICIHVGIRFSVSFIVIIIFIKIV